MVFHYRRAPRPITGPVRAAGTASAARRRHAPGPLGRSCQVESAVHTKAVSNLTAAGLGLPLTPIRQALAEAAIDGGRRAETLSIDDFARGSLADASASLAEATATPSSGSS